MTTDALPVESTTVPAPPGNPTPAEEMQATAGGDGISAAQHREMVLDGLNRGFIDRNRANDELKLAGAEPLKDDEGVSKPKSPEDLASVDDLPAGNVTDFKLPDNLEELDTLVSLKPDGTPGRPVLSDKERVEMQSVVGGWMNAAELPPEIGSYVAKEAGRHVKQMPHYASMPVPEKEAYRLGQMGVLQKLWGDKAAENIALAQSVVDRAEAKQPGLVDFLFHSGLRHNARVVAQLAMQGKRMASRAK
jgi:hypothetical protein